MVVLFSEGSRNSIGSLPLHEGVNVEHICTTSAFLPCSQLDEYIQITKIHDPAKFKKTKKVKYFLADTNPNYGALCTTFWTLLNQKLISAVKP